MGGGGFNHDRKKGVRYLKKKKSLSRSMLIFKTRIIIKFNDWI